MGEVLTRHLKVYCPQHQASFEIAESPKIVCEIKEHALSNNFPREEFWEYCCDCQTFSPSRLTASGKADTSCPRCERPTLSRFLCNVCNVLTVDSGESTRDKRFYLSLEAFAIVPSCPGCLTDFTAKKLNLHKCAEIRAVLETPRETCPFCKKDIVKKIESNQILPEPPMPAPLKIQKESNEQNLTDIRAEQKNFRKEINDLKETMLLLNDKVEKQDKFIQSLRNQLKTVNLNAPLAQPKKTPLQSQTYAEQPQFVKPEPQFPVSAENYLNKIGQSGEMATPDKFSEGLLVQDPNKDQEFIIVKDPTSADGLYYAVPKLTQFSTKSDYNLYYRSFYNCDEPSGGTVWIISPAIVQRVEGGWRSRDKGNLEVRRTDAHKSLPPKLPSIKPEPQFPISVENYLNKVRQLGQKATADIIGGLLIQDPKKGGEFLMIKDSALAEGLFYAVPSLTKFVMKNEYLIYYQSYYDCKNPSGGEIWIISPTIVRRVKDGWKLEKKGELAIGIADAQVISPSKIQGSKSEPPVYKPALQFPISAETYLNNIGNQGEMATRDIFSEGLLIQDTRKDQEFIIVKDAESAAGLYHAMPTFTRFATKSEYLIYYQSYYDCEIPSGGTVWIISPTIVRRVKAGWTLMKKGKLEIRN